MGENTPSPDEARTVIENAPTFGGAFLTALGIDARKVASFTITCVGGGIPLIDITRIACDGDGAALAGVVERFELVRKQGAPAKPVDLQEPVLSLGSLQRMSKATPAATRPGSPT